MSKVIHYLAIVYSYTSDLIVPVLCGMPEPEVNSAIAKRATNVLLEEKRIKPGENIYIYVKVLPPSMLSFFQRGEPMSQGRKLTDGFEGVFEYMVKNYDTLDKSLLIHSLDTIPKLSDEFRIFCKETPAILDEIIFLSNGFLQGARERPAVQN